MSNPSSRQWTVIGATGVLTGLGQGFAAFAVSALLKPIAGELELGRTTVSAAFGFGRLVSGLTSPMVGRSVDRMSPRRIVVFGMVLTAAGLFATGFITASWGLYLTWTLMVSAGVATAFTVSLDKIVIMTVRTGRGMALAVRFAVAGLMTTLAMPIVGGMIAVWGWRMTCMVWAGVILAMLPIALFLLPGQGNAARPKRLRAGASPGEDSAIEPQHATGSGWRKSIATPAFWIISLAFTAQASVITGLSLHLVPLMTDTGLSPEIAASLMGMLVLASIPVRLVTGHLVDRLPAHLLPGLLFAVLLVEAAAIGTNALWPSVATLIPLLLAIGTAMGASTLIILVLISHLFGERAYGSLEGFMMMVQVPGTMAAPIIAGYVYDTTGGYGPAIGGFAVALALAGSSLFFLKIPDAG